MTIRHRAPRALLMSIAACALLTLGCPPEEETPTTCQQDGVTYQVGDSVPSADCNTCTCTESGTVGCTAMGCPPCEPEDCGPALGMPNYPCDDGTMAGPGGCEMQEGGSCGWTVTQCPEESCDDVTCPEGEVCVNGNCEDISPCTGLSCGDTCSDADEDCAEGYRCDPQLVCACAAPEVDLCAEDLCALVACPNAAAYCEENVAYAATYSECDPVTGECLTAPGQPPEDCAELGLACVDGACTAPTCEDGEVWDEAVGACCPGALFIADCFCPDGDVIETEVYDDKGCLLGWDCTCADAGTCTYNGASYASGESFEAGDGCNTCTCFEDGSVACTEMWCGDEGACASDSDCGGGQFCDFPMDDCGAWGGSGTCNFSPDICIAGGPGACGCSGLSMTNGCEIQASGTDVNQYGGCKSMSDGGSFECGDTTCNGATEYCIIQGNDIAGEVAYFSSCSALPAGCGQGDCSCMTTSPLESCYDASGFTMMFYPGG